MEWMTTYKFTDALDKVLRKKQSLGGFLMFLTLELLHLIDKVITLPTSLIYHIVKEKIEFRERPKSSNLWLFLVVLLLPLVGIKCIWALPNILSKWIKKRRGKSNPNYHTGLTIDERGGITDNTTLYRHTPDDNELVKGRILKHKL